MTGRESAAAIILILMKPVVLLNVVGLTPRQVGEHTPRIRSMAEAGSGVAPAASPAASGGEAVAPLPAAGEAVAGWTVLGSVPAGLRVAP